MLTHQRLQIQILFLVLTTLTMQAGEANEIWSLKLETFDIYKKPAIAVAKDGTIALSDPSEQQLVLLKPDGSLIGRLGQKGAGPGEFAQINNVGVLEDGHTIWVGDFQNGRITTWSHQGMLAMAKTKGRFEMWDTTFPHVKGLDQCYYTHGNQGCKDSVTQIRRVDLNGEGETVLHTTQPLPADVGIHVHEGERNITGTLPWDPMTINAFGSTFFAVIYTRDPVVHLYDLNGKAMGKGITLDLKRFPTTHQQQDGLVEAEIPKYMRADLVQLIKRPEFWPAVRGLKVDSRDRIWGFGYTADLDQTAPFVVVDPAGKEVHRGEMAQEPALVAEHVYHLVETEDGGFVLRKAGLPGELG